MSDDNSKWERVESISGAYDVGHATGSLCYLIDDAGRARSEGYHNIRAEKPDAGPDNAVIYYGQRGASETSISPINEQYLTSEE